jgi:outer membrane protein OmpA-like peptidoglycan-associated protein
VNLHTLFLPQILRSFVLIAALTTVTYAQAGNNLVINHFVSDQKVVEGHLVVADVTGSGGSVSMKFYDDKGNLQGEGSRRIPRNGKININPESFVKGKTMTGTVHLSSSAMITAQYWQFYRDGNLGWKNIAVPAAVAPGSTQLVCQHFVSDPNIESYIVIADGEGKGTRVYVEFYSDAGDLAGQTVVNIPANGKFSIQPYNLVGRKVMSGVAYIQTEGALITGEYWQVSNGEKYQVAHLMQGAAPIAEEIADDPLIRIMVNFDFDSDKIQKRSYADLDEVAKAINASRNAANKYEVGGHTDSKGKDAYNMKLSERRAKSVKDYLVKKGKVKASRLLTVGYGETEPMVDNDTEANRARNRRVEFKKIM